ncbi:SCA7-domain-containing protein [Auriculariales sp. MPI-PUGE-AT-0066]|nr:SCA7-domain-containing protein [Auriculariales sp. MPI-PUGE-AT-0066]
MSTAGLRLKFTPSQPLDKTRPFDFGQEPPSSPDSSTSPDEDVQLPAPPTSWLPAKDQRVYGSDPLRSDVGYVKCRDCNKVVIRAIMAEHQDTCKKVKSGLLPPPGSIGRKASTTIDFDLLGSNKKGKKRKADEGIEELGDDGQPKKKAKTTGKPRVKGPVNLDTQCGVINDKGLPCSRALKCKTHSMGAKRAVLGRSKAYDELLLDFNRAHDPHFVEPVKKETKAEKAAAKAREKEEKKLAQQKAKAATTAATATAKKTKTTVKEAPPPVVEEEDLDALDSEAEIESLAIALHGAMRRGVIGVPLATPQDQGNWFVERTEAYQSSYHLLASAFQMKPPRLTGAA